MRNGCNTGENDSLTQTSECHKERNDRRIEGNYGKES